MFNLLPAPGRGRIDQEAGCRHGLRRSTLARCLSSLSLHQGEGAIRTHHISKNLHQRHTINQCVQLIQIQGPLRISLRIFRRRRRLRPRFRAASVPTPGTRVTVLDLLRSIQV